MAPYLFAPVSFADKQLFLRCRLSMLPLAVLTGRRSRPPVPYAQRLCWHCGQEVDSLQHLLLFCPALDGLRARFHHSLDLQSGMLALLHSVRYCQMIRFFAQVVRHQSHHCQLCVSCFVLCCVGGVPFGTYALAK